MALVFFFTVQVVRGVRSPDPRLTFGHDLLPSYAAGSLVRQGRAREMYDKPAVLEIEKRVGVEARLKRDPRYGPWLNPPFYAWVFAPLSGLPYRAALTLFTCINLTLFAAALALLRHMLVPEDSPLPTHVPIDWRTWALLPVLAILPMPVMQAIGHQQNTFISLLLLSATVTCWRENRAMLAGLIAGLLLFKPQLAVLVSGALVVSLGWRALAGVALTGSALLALNLLTLPGTIGDFLQKMPATIHWLQTEVPYNWGRQVTVQSFLRLLIQGNVLGDSWWIIRAAAWTTSLLVIAALALVAWLQRGGGRRSRDRLIAAAIACMPLAMPYYMDYDLSLLLVPAVLLAREWIRQDPMDRTAGDRWILRAWIALFAVTYVNPGLASNVRLNVAVPVLAALAILHLKRASQPAATTDKNHREADDAAWGETDFHRQAA